MAYASELAGPVAPRRRALSGLKWATAVALVAVTVSGGAGSAIVGRRVHYSSGSGPGTTLLVLLVTVVGFVVAIRRPRNPIGWLFLSCAACFALSGIATTYSILDYVHDHGSLPLGSVSLLFAEFWAPAIVLLSVATLLFPDGRLSSRTMRFLLAALLVAAVVWQGGAFGIAVSAIVTHSIHIDSGGDLYAIDHAVGKWAWWYTTAQPAFYHSGGRVARLASPAGARGTGGRRETGVSSSSGSTAA